MEHIQRKRGSLGVEGIELHQPQVRKFDLGNIRVFKKIRFIR
jgi:hypothetical protein